MTRLSSLFWVLLVSATALATFAVKYEVQTLDDRLGNAKKATASQNRELHVLDAEWAYLNRPDMLAAMNQRFLSLAPITRQQMQTAITDIPMRPAPALVAVLDGGAAAGVPPAVAAAIEEASRDATSPDAASRNAMVQEDAVSTASVHSRPAAPARLALATVSARPLLVKAAAVSRARALDNRSLDQLIARIAAER